MKNMTRKHLWPAALVAALAVVGMLAAFVVLSGPERGTAEAQGICDTASGVTLQGLIDSGVCDAPATPSPSPTTGGSGPGAPGEPSGGAGLCADVSPERLRQLIQAGLCREPTATPVPPTATPTMPPATSGPPAPQPTATPAPTATATPGATGTPGPTATPLDAPTVRRDVPRPTLTIAGNAVTTDTENPPSLSRFFSEPIEDHPRTYQATSDMPAIAFAEEASLRNGELVVRRGDEVDVTAPTDVTITVQARNGAGARQSPLSDPVTFTVTVLPETRDVSLRVLGSSPPEGVDRVGNTIRVTTGADPVIKLHRLVLRATPLLTTGDVTVSVLVKESNDRNESRRNQLFIDSVNLDDADEGQLEDGEFQKGLLTVRATDRRERTFTIRARCVVVGDRLDIVIRDHRLAEVGRAIVRCVAPEGPAPTVTETDPECYQIIADRDGMYPASQNPQDRWWSVRDQWWDDRRNMTTGLRTAQQGRNTIEALLNEPRLQLTVTACEEGPVYIRFLDANEAPFDPGLRVLGLDSRNKLELNLGGNGGAGPNFGPADAASGSYPAGSANWAHWYDHFTVTRTVDADGEASEVLAGNPGTYYQGKFRYFDPCPTVDHQFYVQVYENKGKDLRTQERISCGVDPAAPLQPSNLSVTTYNARPGVAVLQWTPVAEADRHLVVVIDTATRRAVPVPSVLNHEGTTITGLANGKQYAFAVVAQSGQGASATYTVGLIYQTMSWPSN